ncbi:MAG: SGNH/GDSL hydrolase family protein [Verrucomicrobia bacterium]|nr:MAG: SGNH/GDSL hydrolase family protein [Verrucomicrobiota bacterium]
MTKLPLLLVFLFSAPFVGCAAEPTVPPAREAIEWCDIWISHANKTNLPRVLLIGDSITRDYYPEVEKRLAGKAYVGRLSSAAFVADPALRQQVQMVLGQYKFAVIHFNNGMHGWHYSEADYGRALPALIATIRSNAPQARLIWANTTPLRDGKGANSDPQSEYSDERVVARNKIAEEIMTTQKIPVNDLFTPMLGHPEYHSDNVHFNGQGIQVQAAKVAGAVEKELAR